MRKLRNVLYVMTQGMYLRKEGETLIAELQGEKKLQLPLLNLEGLVCFGNVMCSPFLLQACAKNNIGVSFVSEYGEFLARVVGPISGNVKLRRAHYAIIDNEPRKLHLARAEICAKLLNSRILLQRFLRDHTPDTQNQANIQNIIKRLKQSAREALTAPSIESLRGIEGSAGADYFSGFNALIVAQKNDFVFNGRNRRPPRDPVNAMLSFVYMLLTHDMTAALESVGLDPQVGFFHAERSGRASLSLDMIEPFRAWIADRLVLSLINLKQVKKNEFVYRENNTVEIKDSARKTILSAYQERKQELIMHPYLNEKIKIGLLLYAQAMLLAAYIRDDIEAYPPFLAR